MLKKISEIRDNISIRTRIIAVTIVVTLLLIIAATVVSLAISSINRETIKSNKERVNNLVKLSDFTENLYVIIIKTHIINENSLGKYLINNTLQIDLLEGQLAAFRAHIDASDKEAYDKLIFECRNYVAIVKQIKSLELNNKYKEASIIRNKEEFESFNRLNELLKSLRKANNERLNDATLELIRLDNVVFKRIYLGMIIILLSMIFVMIYIFSGLKGQLKSLSNNLSVMDQGRIPKEKLNTNKSELGKMAYMLNSISSDMSDLYDFATDLGRGNYSSKLKSISSDNILAKALINLRDSLKLNKEEDERRKREEEIRNWTNSGHTLFGEILRQRSKGIKHLADDIIRNIVKYLSANQGGLFVINDDTVELISTFAYDRKKFVQRNIKVGDGLIGTVALEKNTVYLDKIPDNYIEIESGLGDANPSNLLIVPLNFEDNILGIVEIASFKTIKKHEIKFVEELGQSIASTLLTVKINARTEQLLNDSQKKSKELALRDIESRNNLKKMKAAQKLAERREADLTGILSAVDNTLMKGEYELDGTLISVNNRHLQTMGYQLREIKGKNIEIFIPIEELEEFRKLWASVVSGNPRQIEVKRKTKTGETLWLINQYTPVTNSDGKISRVLYLAHDITKYKLKEHDINNNKDRLDSVKKTEELKLEIEQKKKDLKRIEQEIDSLNEQKIEIINKSSETEVDKMYAKWLASL